MRRISEMYKRSGGTIYNHTCKECVFLTNDKNIRGLSCQIHGDNEDNHDWKKEYTACKFFADNTKATENYRTQRQITLFDYLKINSDSEFTA